MTFSHRITLRLPHTDAAGVVFYGRLFELTQECFEVGMEAAGHPLHQLLTGSVLLPVVHAEADYRGALRIGDDIVCQCRLEAGGRSVRLETAMSVRGTLVVTAVVVHSVLDPATGGSAPLPQELCAALA